MTTAAATSIGVEGFEGEYTSYALEVRDPRVDLDAGTVTIDVFTGKRDGNSAVVKEANYVLRADGEEIDRKENAEWVEVSGRVERAVSLSGEIDTDSDTVPMSLEVSFPNYSAARTVDFEVETPDPVSESDLSIDCSADPSEVKVGERVTVTATVENTSEFEAEIEVTVELAGATDDSTETVPGGESVEREARFEMEEVGEYDPRVEATLA